MILLDTQVLLWLLYGDHRLGRHTRRVIDQAFADGSAAVSAISFWEVAMLHAKGRLALLTDIGSWREGLIEDGWSRFPLREASRYAPAFFRTCTATRPTA